MARARGRYSGIGTATPRTGMDHTRPCVIHTGCVVSVGHRPALGQATSGSTTGVQTEGRPLYLPAGPFTEATVLLALQARRSEALACRKCQVLQRQAVRAAAPSSPSTSRYANKAAALTCVYMALRSLDPTGKGRKRWTMPPEGILERVPDRLRESPDPRNNQDQRLN